MAGRKFAVFDIDGTIFRWQLYYEVELKLAAEGVFKTEYTKRLQDALFNWQSRTTSFSDFERVAIEVWNQCLPNLRTRDFDSAVKAVIDQSAHKVYRYTRELARSLKQEGYFLLAISGSHQEVAEPFSQQYGFDDCIGWIYEKRAGSFTGKTLRSTIGNKDRLLLEYIKQHGLDLKKSVAVGDSKGDITILKLVSRPIAFNPSEELLQEAMKKGWEIVIERKNIAYHLQKGEHGTFVLAKADRY